MISRNRSINRVDALWRGLGMGRPVKQKQTYDPCAQEYFSSHIKLHGGLIFGHRSLRSAFDVILRRESFHLASSGFDFLSRGACRLSKSPHSALQTFVLSLYGRWLIDPALLVE
jgi:hypothetical protein